MSAKTKKKLKWAFAGATPQGLEILTTLYKAGFEPQLVYFADEMKDSEKAAFGKLLGEEKIKDLPNIEKDTANLNAMDLLLICRFQLVGKAVFDAPKLGSANIHNSLLPKYRGVHPISWSIINGDDTTGVTIHKVDAGIDTGQILDQREIAISPEDTVWTLSSKINTLSANMALSLLNYIETEGNLPESKPQYGESSYARRRTPEDGRISGSAPAQLIYNMVRALQNPLPPAYFEFERVNEVPVLRCRVLKSSQTGNNKLARVLMSPRHGTYLIQTCDGLIEIETPIQLKDGEAALR